MHIRVQGLSSMRCVKFYSRAREAVFIPSVLGPGEQMGEGAKCSQPE